jgi:hypothetical protein
MAPSNKIRLSPAEERSHRILGITMLLLGYDDQHLADVLGLSRQAGRQRRTGGTRLRQQDLEDISASWNLPIGLFRMTPLDAAHWLLNERGAQIPAVA